MYGALCTVYIFCVIYFERHKIANKNLSSMSIICLQIGEPFAEQPLAIAVQEGSLLAKELSEVRIGHCRTGGEPAS
jgi:hypothetical protein